MRLNRAATTVFLAVLLHFPLRLVDDAVTGWVNAQIADALGITSPSWRTVMTWAGQIGWLVIVPLVLASALLWAYHRWHDPPPRARASVSPSQRAAIARDVWLADAIQRACTGKWGEPRTASIFTPDPDTGQAFVGVALAQVRQYARDGALPIWGKSAPYRPFEPIPPEFWSGAGVDIFSVLKTGSGFENLYTEDNPHAYPRRWGQLMTSEAKVNELWPSKE
jgi:hypothetical protein